jgi:hypothetical protein
MLYFGRLPLYDFDSLSTSFEEIKPHKNAETDRVYRKYAQTAYNLTYEMLTKLL